MQHHRKTVRKTVPAVASLVGLAALLLAASPALSGAPAGRVARATESRSAAGSRPITGPGPTARPGPVTAPTPETRQAGPSAVVDAARRWRQDNERAIVAELLELLSIPNVAANLDDIRRNAEWLVAALEARGVRTRLLETAGAPYVLGEIRVPDAERTLLFYCHYDGQPADPARWVGHDPWEPIFRDGKLDDGAATVRLPASGPLDPDWRIYGRSASDDSSPIVMLLAALDALDAAGMPLRSNVKFLFEGDEEAGSPNMEATARGHREALAADLAVIADGPKHPSGRPTLTFGVRGITTAQITVYGPAQPLHSGHYGNWAPNPALRLARLLASMKDEDTGRVLVEGWYDDRVPLTQTELAALETVPDAPAQSPGALGFAAPEGEWARRVEAITWPSLNVRGMSSGWVGDEARTIVPDSAVAELDLRLVADIRPRDQVARLVEHVRRQGYHVVEGEPDAETRARHPMLARVVLREPGYPAARTSMDLPVSRSVRERLRSAFDVEPVALPTSGGSVPIYAFTDVLEVPTVLVPTVNHDNNQHSPNENLRIGHLWDGIEILAVLLTLE